MKRAFSDSHHVATGGSFQLPNRNGQAHEKLFYLGLIPIRLVLGSRLNQGVSTICFTEYSLHVMSVPLFLQVENAHERSAIITATG